MKRELLDNGNIWQKSDGRWIGMVRYKDEYGVTQRKSFSSKKKKTLQAKMTEYVKNFQDQTPNSDEARKPLKESMTNWLRVYKFPEVERTTYDRYECTAEHQIYPYIGNKPVGDVTPADIKGQVRSRDVAYPRQICMYLCKKYTGLSLSVIGEALGGRDHSTVSHGVEKIETQMARDESLKKTIDILTKKLNP